MTEEEKKAIESLNRKITTGKCEKNVGIPVYISELEILLNLIQKQDTEINKLNNVIDLMSRAILNYDDQLVINQYRDKEHVKETFTEYVMKEDK